MRWPDEGRTLRGELVRTFVYGMFVAPFTIFLALQLGLRGVSWLVGFIVFTIAGGAVIRLVTAALQGAGEEGVRSFIAVSGRSTPASPDHSFEQSLVERGDIAGALAAYEARITTSPGDVAARIHAADLYAGPGADPGRAAALFDELRRIDGVEAQHELYATNRLIDLYTGPLDRPRRALAELRRLIDRYPGSRIAAQARTALAELKAELLPQDGFPDRGADDSGPDRDRKPR